MKHDPPERRGHDSEVGAVFNDDAEGAINRDATRLALASC